MAGGIALAQMKDVRLSLGGAPLFEGVGFTLHKGERAAFVGANGAGKSTLMRMLAGFTEPDAGDIVMANGAVVAFAAQEPSLSGFATLKEYVCARSSPATLTDTPAHDAEAALHAFGLDPERATEGLSGGETRRASLARAFAADPDVLLLDEPTNHLDIAAIEDLEDRVAAFTGACLVISHDRRFLERVSNTMLWLRQRRVLKLERGFTAFDDWEEDIERADARALAKLETDLKAEEHWLQRGVTARRSRNEGRRRRLEDMRAERRRRKTAMASPKAGLQAEKGFDSAKLVAEARHVTKSYGDKPVVSDFSLRILRGDRIGIVGPNGAGKSTLLELLLKLRAPDSGDVRIGANLEIAYVDQARGILKPTDTLWDALAPQGGDHIVVRGRSRHVAAYARDFLFSHEQLRQPVASLSGGERNRLALAVALARPANLLVLDEPTNDLDMDTLDALEEMLSSYDGTVLIVSHDRAFLDGVTTQIVGALGGGKWVETPGGWADFEREHPERLDALNRARVPRSSTAKPPPEPAEAKRPTKLSYKDERRLGELEGLLPKLETEIVALEEQLSHADSFARDPKAFEAAAARLAAARNEKSAAETEWLDLEHRREELQNQ